MPDSFIHRPLTPLGLVAAGMIGTFLAASFACVLLDFFSFSPHWPLSAVVAGLIFAFVFGLPFFGLLALLNYWYSRKSN